MSWDKTITIVRRGTPEIAPSGAMRMFFRTSDGVLCTIDDAGVERVYTTGFTETEINNMIAAQLYYRPVGWAQYTNSALQDTTATNTAFTKVVIDTDKDSSLNSLFTKVNTTDIRAEFNGHVSVGYKSCLQNISTNDKSSRLVVIKNGAELSYTHATTIGKTNTDRHGSVSGEFIIPCAVNDVFSIGFSNGEAITDTIRIEANSCVFRVEAKKRV